MTISVPPYLRDPDPAQTIEPAEAFTITTAHGTERHHRDAFGQIGHHRPSDPNCPRGPSKEKEDE